MLVAIRSVVVGQHDARRVNWMVVDERLVHQTVKILRAARDVVEVKTSTPFEMEN